MAESQALFGWRREKVRGWKIMGGWKIRRIEKFWFSLICVWLEEWKSRRVEKYITNQSMRESQYATYTPT